MITGELLEIVKADKKARERISGSKELSERMQKKLDEDTAALNEKYSNESEKSVKENQAKQLKILEDTEKQFTARFEKTSAAINSLYEKKKNTWISEIVSKVTEQ